MTAPTEDITHIPFEDQLAHMSELELHDHVCNWLWEIPPEFTPSEKETLRLIEIIEARKDAKMCDRSLALCRDYLSYVTKVAPNEPTSQQQRGRTAAPIIAIAKNG